jgi:hypothetical protein
MDAINRICKGGLRFVGWLDIKPLLQIIFQKSQFQTKKIASQGVFRAKIALFAAAGIQTRDLLSRVPSSTTTPRTHLCLY